MRGEEEDKDGHEEGDKAGDEKGGQIRRDARGGVGGEVRLGTRRTWRGMRLRCGGGGSGRDVSIGRLLSRL